MVSSNIPLNTENFVIVKRGPSILYSPLSFSSNKNISTLFSQGVTELKVSFPSNNYKLGDVVPLTVSVDNLRGVKNVTLIKINLKRVVTFKLKNSNKKYVMKVKAYEEKNDFFVEKGKIKEDVVNFPLFVPKNKIPYNFSKEIYKTDNYNFLPTVESLLLSCQYYIKVSCYFGLFVSKENRPAVKMPIVISHQVMSDINEKQNENNHINFEYCNDFTIINKENAQPVNEGAPPQEKCITTNNINTVLYDKI